MKYCGYAMKSFFLHDRKFSRWLCLKFRCERHFVTWYKGKHFSWYLQEKSDIFFTLFRCELFHFFTFSLFHFDICNFHFFLKRNFNIIYNIYNINYNIIINNYPILYIPPQVRLHTGCKNGTEIVDFLSKHRTKIALLIIFFVFNFFVCRSQKHKCQSEKVKK